VASVLPALIDTRRVRIPGKQYPVSVKTIEVKRFHEEAEIKEKIVVNTGGRTPVLHFEGM
jgi:hypothetical protein